MATNPAAPTTMPDQLRQPLVQKDGLWDRTWFNWFLKQWNTVKGSLSGSGTPTGLAIWATANTLGSGTLSGDVTTPANSTVATLANSGVTAGTYGDGTHVPQVTFDAKGRATAASNVAITANVTHTGTLTAGVPIVGNGGADITIATNQFLVSRTTVTLTDAQIKAMPTTPFIAIAAPGAGLVTRVFAATVRLDSTAGAYTNLNATFCALQIGYASGQTITNDLYDSSAAGFTSLTGFLGTAALRRWSPMGIGFLDYFNAAAGDGLEGYSSVNTDIVNQAVQVSVDNNGSGNLTGGNAANTLRVTLYSVSEPD